MKSILVIGMGRFGRHLALKFMDMKNDVMIVDQNESIIEEMSSFVTDAEIGDCTKEAVLRSLGVSNFDMCFVAIGENFQASLEITSLLKELGAKHVVAKANRDIHAKFLLRNGADEVVYPERAMAERLAMRCSAKNVFDYIELTPEYSIMEIPIMENWAENSIEKIAVRTKYHISILAIKKGTTIIPMPKADYIFHKNDHLVVIGKASDVIKLASHI